MSAATVFAFDAERARSALARMKVAREAIDMPADEFAQGSMAALLEAELLAADAGIVPYLTLPSGERGIVTIGAARERIDKAPEDVRAIYLATHEAARQAFASSARVEPGNDTAALGNPAVLITLIVIGIAAVIATAWAATEVIRLGGNNVRAMATAREVTALAREQLAKTGRIDPAVWEALRGIGQSSESPAWLPWAIGGGVVAVGGGALAWKWTRKGRGRR